MNDDTGQVLERLALALERHAETLTAGANALSVTGQNLAADAAYLTAASWQSVADALHELAAAPADQRCYLADNVALPGASDLGDEPFARPVADRRAVIVKPPSTV